MAPSPILVRPPALANSPLPPPRCVAAVAAAPAVRTAPAAPFSRLSYGPPGPCWPFSPGACVPLFCKISWWHGFSWSRRLRTKCRFAASDVREDYSSTPIDIVADVKTEKASSRSSLAQFMLDYLRRFHPPLWTVSRRLQIVVLGGSGFVGSAICRAAVSKGIEVVSFSRYFFCSSMWRTFLCCIPCRSK
jgi:hypothetical protein